MQGEKSMKTVIIYYSKHHGNTKKLLDAIKKESQDEITLVEAASAQGIKLADYDRIGFASGIYYSKFDKRVLEYAKEHTPSGKDVFFIYTYGTEKPGYTKAIREALTGKNVNIMGEYGCLGFNTYGPFKLIGGMAKNHPDETDVKNAISFYNNLSK